MIRKIKICLVSILILAGYSTSAQELNFTIQINTQQIQSSDKNIYDNMKNSIMEFMNNKRWTNEKFLNQERIEFSMLITISERVSNDEFKASAQIQSRRPIFSSSYFSSLLNYNDVDFNFKYLEFQNLEFNENTHLSNLTSLLAYYAYLIIGLDYDSFSLYGGTPYFQKAQTIVSNAQSSPDKGWKAYDGSRNRYWLIENILNPQLKSIREVYYIYHRSGLDIMSENVINGRKEISQSIDLLKKANKEKPSSIFLQLFLTAKSDELVNIFSEGYPDEKSRIFASLSELDPANVSRYQEIMKRK